MINSNTKIAGFRISFLLIFFSIHLQAQQFAGQLMDSMTLKPVTDASILIKGTSVATKTDSAGRFTLQISDRHVILVVFKLGYQNMEFDIGNNPQGNHIFYVKSITYQLPEINITDKPTAITRNASDNVLDYNFMGDAILLLNQVNASEKKLTLISNNGVVLQSIIAPYKAKKLFKDCFDNIHIITNDNSYQLHFDGTMKLLEPYSIKQFDQYLLPCVAQTDSNLIFKEVVGPDIVIPSEEPNGFDTKKNKHIAWYYAVNKITHQKKTIRWIADIEMMKKSAGEEEYLEYTYKDRIHGCKSCARVQDERYIFKEIYTPLMVLKDTFVIFNHPDSVIEYYSSSGERLNKNVHTTYHHDVKWKWITLIDESRHKAYGLFLRGNHYELNEINISTGQAGKTIKIPHPFVRNIKLKDGFVYYLYSSTGELDTNVLYHFPAGEN